MKQRTHKTRMYAANFSNDDYKILFRAGLIVKKNNKIKYLDIFSTKKLQ